MLAAIMMVIAAFLPMAYFIPDNMNESLTMFNGVITGGECRSPLLVLFLPALLSLTFLVDIYCIFKYEDLKKQKRICNTVMLILFLWYISYFSLMYIYTSDDMHAEGSIYALLPLVSMICVFCAKRRIRHDWELIRSVDRIR